MGVLSVASQRGTIVEPLLCDLCHKRLLILKDYFHRHGLFLIDICTTCYERPLLLGRFGGLKTGSTDPVLLCT